VVDCAVVCGHPVFAYDKVVVAFEIIDGVPSFDGHPIASSTLQFSLEVYLIVIHDTGDLVCSSNSHCSVLLDISPSNLEKRK
jgi:hypothetical protein